MKPATLLTYSLILATPVFAQDSAISFTAQPTDIYAPRETSSFTIEFSINSTETPTVEFVSGSPFDDFDVSSGSTETRNINGMRTYKWGYILPKAAAGTTHQYRLRASNSTNSVESNLFRVTMVSGLLNTAENLGNSYFQNSTLGLIYAGATPWLYQDQGLGWIAPSDDATAISAWLYSPLADIGWLYYEAFQYPWMFSTEQNSWVYFVYQDKTRGFYVQSTGQWIFRQ
ncbi:hypothetical protein [Rubellicoccus peritrichatus]|uniref:Uncharacterized protein n=1 Tax=Rubellicoccus peritrichatus TaxID=3080537 RepID=A0AAQ3LCR8_9BACT|nr:hypothetical protein [Puniceicoccus sp. CR14]WOO43091.1 hypothetical protein RZN69_08295 [Puniceicoccus sp. CR14]